MGKFNLKALKDKKFHFIGIGGISMSALAQMLKSNGYYVQGSDDVKNDEVVKLLKKKIKVYIGHREFNVVGAEVVVVNSAIKEDNPEYVYAVKNNLIIIKRAELLGLIAELYKTVIAVSGSHGKTTTTAMISELFVNAGLKPTVHIGGVLNSINSNYKLGNKKYFITENCEYQDNFLYVSPDLSIILNIDADHLDYFWSLKGVKSSFLKYAKNTKDGGINLVCGDDKHSRILFKLENSVKFGIKKRFDIYACNILEYKSGFYSFDVCFANCNLGNIKLNIVGKHNINNALAAIFAGIIFGISFEVVKNSIENFSGVKRRCEYVGKVNDAIVFHDYAHHPKQIEKMISVAKSCIVNEGKVIVVFEPHTYSRTKYLIQDFAKSFCDADVVLLAPVYSAREKETDGMNSLDLLEHAKKYVKNCVCIDEYKEIAKMVKHIAERGDVVLILGAGTIEKLSNLLVD